MMVLEQGHVIQQGSQRDLTQYPRSSYVAELVGMNFFRGHIVACETNRLCTIQLQGHGQPGIKVSAVLEDHAQTRKVPGTEDEDFVLVYPRSISLYQTLPDSPARNVFHDELL